MLTNEAKTILDYLISTFPNYESPMMNFSVISENTGLILPVIDSALKYLESLGYVKIKRYKNGGFVQDVTHQGMHYKELESVSTATAQTNIFNAPVTGSALSLIHISPCRSYRHRGRVRNFCTTFRSVMQIPGR